MPENREYLFAKKGNTEFLKIYLEDIYYIETIKGTHYCKIQYKGGGVKIKSSIKDINEKLGNPFWKVKSSTIANLSLVTSVSYEYRILYFSEEIFCTFATSSVKSIKGFF